MSTWSRSSYNTTTASGGGGGAAEPSTRQWPDADGWQTVGKRNWGSSQQQQSQDSSSNRWSSASGGGGGGSNRRWDETPSAFSKKPRDGDRPPRRQTEEEAQRDYVMKLAAQKSAKEAEQAKQLVDTEDNFPVLSAPKRSTATATAPLPKKSWATQIKTANDENEQKRLAEEKVAKEAADKLADNISVISLNRREMRQPFFTTGTIEKEVDFLRNEALRSSIWDEPRACFASSIMEEQEKYDYNQNTGYGNDSLDDEAPRDDHRVYSPHSPPYSPTYHEEEE